MTEIHDAQRLKELQALPIERKIQITQTRIIEWYNYYNGKVCVSFSGGKDSTVLLHIARRIFSDIEAVFADTGLEYPEIREFVKSYDNVMWVKPEKNFKDVITEYGYPVVSKHVAMMTSAWQRGSRTESVMKGFEDRCTYHSYNMGKWKYLQYAPFKISDKCCDIIKEKPLKKYQKSVGKYPIIATLAAESDRRKSGWIKTGCNAFESKEPMSKPMSFWTKQDVLQYIKRYNIPIASVYGNIIEEKGKLKTTGADRTGCMYCMFSCHRDKAPNRFQRMAITHPKIYDYCMRSTDTGGLGMAEVLDYIGVDYKPKENIS